MPECRAPASARPLRGCESPNSHMPVETFEDEIKAEVVFVAVVVAGLEDVLKGQLGEARVLLGGELQEERFGAFGGLLRVPKSRVLS